MTFSNNWYNAEQPKQQNFIIKNKKYKKYNKLIINKLCFLYFLSSFSNGELHELSEVPPPPLNIKL